MCGIYLGMYHDGHKFIHLFLGGFPALSSLSIGKHQLPNADASIVGPHCDAKRNGNAHVPGVIFTSVALPAAPSKVGAAAIGLASLGLFAYILFLLHYCVLRLP